MPDNTPRNDHFFSADEISRILSSLPSDARGYVDYLEKQIRNLSVIGLALSREKDMNRLLEMILREAKRIADADGGTLYMATDDGRLEFKIILTDSLNFHMGGTSGNQISFDPLPLFAEDGCPNRSMVAAYVAITGETINIPDAYEAEGFDFSGTRSFDRKTGYRSQSFLTVPLKNHVNDIIGVLQLLNAQDRKTGGIVPFSSQVQEIVESLSSLAAVAITNRNLISDLSGLFESFIQLIAGAIDAKSPYTGGHCERVSVITQMIAEAINRQADGPLGDVHFNEDEMYELRIAAWLHDCGKVTTPEYVVDKSTKLETIYDRIHEVATRVQVIRRDYEIGFLKKKIRLLSDRSLHDSEKKQRLKRFERERRESIKTLEDDLSFIARVNTGSEFMSEEDKQRIKTIAGLSWHDGRGKKPLLTDNEAYNLSIARGTLTDEERKVINDHIVLTIKMLEELPYPKHLRNVPKYAGGHHETLAGTGYPRGLRKDQLTIQARILAIADIFEALTASDRPYKKAKTLGEALRILGFMKEDEHIDPDIFDIFMNEKIYLRYAENFLEPGQVDVS